MKIITDLKAIKRLGKLRQEENEDFRMYVRELPYSIKAIDKAVETACGQVSRLVDCTVCANCCRQLNPTLTQADAKRLARHLGLTVAAFTTRYLQTDSAEAEKTADLQKTSLPVPQKKPLHSLRGAPPGLLVFPAPPTTRIRLQGSPIR